MPHIVSTLEFHAKVQDHLWQMMRRVYEQLANVINGNIGLGTALNLTANNIANPANTENIRGAIVFCNFLAPNTNLVITHNLGYVARSYIPIAKLVAGDVYDGTPLNNTTTQITLRCTSAGGIVLLIF